MGCQPGSSESALCHLVGSWVAALPFVPPLPGDRIRLTHSARREVASGPATRRVPTPRHLGVEKKWRCLRSRTLRLLRLLSQRGTATATTLSTRPHSSITLVFTLERAFNLDTSMICIFLDKDCEHLIESKKVQCLELFPQEVDFVFVGLEGPSTLSTISRGFLPTLQQIKPERSGREDTSVTPALLKVKLPIEELWPV